MSLFDRFFNRRERGMEFDMAEQDGKQTATPPANSGGISESQLSAALAAALKPLSDEIASLKSGQATIDNKIADAIAKVPTGLNEDAAKKLIADQLAAGRKTEEATTARKAFVEKSMSKLPAIYQGKLGDDPTKWEVEAAEIQKQYEADFKISGGKGENVGTTKDGGTTAAQAQVDHSKVSGWDLLSEAVKNDTVQPREAAQEAAAK